MFGNRQRVKWNLMPGEHQEYARKAFKDTELIELFGPEAPLSSRKGRNAQVTPSGVSFERVTYRGETFCDRKEFLARVRRAIKQGASQEGRVVTWTLFAGSKYPCTNPIERGAMVGLRCRPRPDGYAAKDVIGRLIYQVRCRKCDACKQQNQKQWISRIIVEAQKCVAATGRVWFVTLTGNASFRDFLEMKAKGLAHSKRKEWGKITEGDRFGFRAKAMKKEITKYMKRVRKGVGKKHNPKVRFVAVTEPHKDFNVHAHILIFEMDPAQPVSERLLRQRWRSGGRGIADAELVRSVEDAPWYVAKYINKDASTVQASKYFGQKTP